MASSVDDLNRLYPNWSAKGLTWVGFGACSRDDIENLKKKWFSDPEEQIAFQDIWIRYPRNQG